MQTSKTVWVALIAVAIIAVAGCFLPILPSGKSLFGDISGCNGSTSCFTNLYASGQLQVSSTGTSINNIAFGSGAIIGNVSQTATTTKAYDIAAVGCLSGDKVLTEQASSTAVLGGFQITAASASTTAGYVTLSVFNGSGAAAVVPNAIASSTTWLCLR